MLTADLKNTTTHADQTFANAKNSISDRLKALGIEDATDFATSVGYLVVGAYGITMVLNLALNY